MSALLPEGLEDAIAAATKEAQDTTNGRPSGNIVYIGCEQAGYDCPDEAASAFIGAMAQAAITAYLAATRPAAGAGEVNNMALEAAARAIAVEAHGYDGNWPSYLSFARAALAARSTP